MPKLGNVFHLDGKTRTALAVVLGLIMVGSIAAVANPAFAASGSLFLNVSPKKAILGAGDDIVLSGDFRTDVSNDIIKIVVTLLGSRHEFSFDKNGGIIDHDSAFKKPHTKLTVLGKNTNDPYEISKQRLQFWIPIKKNVLGVGDYKALVEVITNSGTFDQDESFKIMPKPGGNNGGHGGHGNGNHDSNLSVISVIVNSSGKGNNVNVIAVVVNNGKSSSGAFNVNAVLSSSGGGNGISLASVNVNSLGAGQTSIVALNGHDSSGSSSSSQLISVNADSNNSVDESNENDNHMSRHYRHY